MAYTPRLRINPPLVISQPQALEGVAILDAALAALVARGDRPSAVPPA
jgi:4-aminobutyrate aminotransferase-like enzyme